MEGIYEVFLGEKNVGKVQLEQQGLYIRILCRCWVDSRNVFRLYAAGDGKRENIGVLIPDGDSSFLEKKIPVKRLGNRVPRFYISSGTGKLEGTYIPVVPEEPFAYLSELNRSFLASENGKIGIRIPHSPNQLN